MEITLLRKPEELLLAFGKEEFLEDYDFHIDGNEFYIKLFPFNIRGQFLKRIEENIITLLFNTKIGGIKVDIIINKYDEYSSKLKISMNSWGIIGKLLKEKLNEIFLDLIIDMEFRNKPYLSLERKLFVKMQTSKNGLKELIEKLSENPSHYFLLVIDKKYIIEIVNGTPLVGEELEEYCKEFCSIELYELKPNPI